MKNIDSELIEDVYEPRESISEEIDGADEGELIGANQRRSVSPAKNDRSLAELHKWLSRGNLVIDPEWQREYVWDNKRASRLVESFLIDLPIPVVYLAANAENRFEVIDGVQRLTSMFRFFDNKYALKGLEIRRDLNNEKFQDLDASLQFKLEAATVRTFELAADTDKDLMFLIFERLNTGGVALADMEIRNCLYRGALNNLLKRLAQDDNFRKATNQKNLQLRMVDRSLVLRFLAFYQMTYMKARKGIKAFLNEFLQTYRNAPEAQLQDFEDKFRRAMRVSFTVFGKDAFRLRQKRDGSNMKEFASRINASIFQVVSVSFTLYDTAALLRASDAIYEEYLDLIACDEKWVDSVTISTGVTQKIEYAFETWNIRLKALMASHQANDPIRGFSRRLKSEMFEQNNTCALCYNEIRDMNDAHLDHIQHYWRGGRTIPENARLVHRSCNLARNR